MRVTVSTFLAGVLLATSAWAQESRATINGRVSDPTGAVVSGATVRATNTATNAAASSVANENGNYEIPYLLSGVYNLSVEMPGFKKYLREGVQLRIGDRVTLDVTLELGDVTDSVTVAAETPLLTASTADMGLVMEQRRGRSCPWLAAIPFT